LAIEYLKEYLRLDEEPEFSINVEYKVSETVFVIGLAEVLVVRFFSIINILSKCLRPDEIIQSVRILRAGKISAIS